MVGQVLARRLGPGGFSDFHLGAMVLARNSLCFFFTCLFTPNYSSKEGLHRMLPVFGIRALLGVSGRFVLGTTLRAPIRPP